MISLLASVLWSNRSLYATANSSVWDSRELCSNSDFFHTSMPPDMQSMDLGLLWKKFREDYRNGYFIELR